MPDYVPIMEIAETIGIDPTTVRRLIHRHGQELGLTVEQGKSKARNGRWVDCLSMDDRNRLIGALKSQGITAAFHYQSLHKSPFFLKENNTLNLPNSDMYSSRLIRLPLHHRLSVSDTEFIAETIKKFYED